MYYSFRNVWFPLFLSLLVPCRIFDSFLLSESILGALILPVLVLNSARTMHGPAEHFIHQEQSENWSRVWLHMQWPTVRKDQLDSCARFIDATLDPSCSLFRPHSSMGDTSCMWDASSIKWYGTFSQWDLGIPQVSHNMSRMCAYLRMLQKYTNEYVFLRR